jgi:hypothetical protein
VFCWMLCRYVHCICTCVLVTVCMYVYIHCVFKIHCNSSCLLHFDVATELRLFVCIDITVVAGAVGGKCPLRISLPNNSVDCQETVRLVCERANCVYV